MENRYTFVGEVQRAWQSFRSASRIQKLVVGVCALLSPLVLYGAARAMLHDWSAKHGASSARIVFQSVKKGNADIHVVNANGDRLKRLTTDPGEDRLAAWSPDGSRIAFHSTRGSPGLYVMNTNGSGVTPVASDAYQAVWSPDGGRLAFVANGHIYVRLLADTMGSSTLITSGQQSISGLSWSRDGTRIAFQASADVRQDRDIYVINADGSNEVRLTRDSRSKLGLAWSPDGSRIAFAGTGGIFVLDSHGAGDVRLAALRSESPDWSPDGQRIAVTVTEYNGGRKDVWVVRADGSGKKRLTSGRNANFSPRWSPDGKQIAYVAYENRNIVDQVNNTTMHYEAQQIRVMKPNGSGKYTVSGSLTDCDTPSWSPLPKQR